MNIESVRNHIIFQFVEKNLYGRFINEAASGILISSEDTKQTNYPRWGKVVAVGPDEIEVSTDDYILIEPGKWTPRFQVDGQDYWKTDSFQVICASDKPYTTY